MYQNLSLCFRNDRFFKYSGLEHDAEKAPAYQLLTSTIKLGCDGAIWLSERI